MDMLSKHTIRSGFYCITATGYYKMQIGINGLYDTNCH